MNDELLRNQIVAFFSSIDTYYGVKLEVTESIYTALPDVTTTDGTWNLSEFVLVNAAYRKDGNRFMIEGTGRYIEFAALHIVGFTQSGRHKYEIVEQYGNSVFRVTKLRFFDPY